LGPSFLDAAALASPAPATPTPVAMALVAAAPAPNSPAISGSNPVHMVCSFSEWRAQAKGQPL
jgi:hypothetical protein